MIVLEVVNHVQYYRKQAGLTQENLAQLVNVSRKTINSLERGNYTPSLLLALQISKVLHRDINDIFSIEE
ncbi:helix-turn-helix transcriptional regulator [Leuconostoc sp. C2]|uniref:helix-turn-helix transcriptional regulator n=1 Tax=Leuconostoc sp. (strain C2) TaxID=979982 RepID=UPI001FA78DDB|nr:helix-turn-helix transcriptional regulator [Leuconostoc sp. C2]